MISLLDLVALQLQPRTSRGCCSLPQHQGSAAVMTLERGYSSLFSTSCWHCLSRRRSPSGPSPLFIPMRMRRRMMWVPTELQAVWLRLSRTLHSFLCYVTQPYDLQRKLTNLSRVNAERKRTIVSFGASLQESRGPTSDSPSIVDGIFLFPLTFSCSGTKLWSNYVKSHNRGGKNFSISEALKTTVCNI